MNDVLFWQDHSALTKSGRWPARVTAGKDLSGVDVRFGSLADICSAKGHVRFTPNSDRESEFPQQVMSALPPKADMCGADTDVRFGPKADMAPIIRSPRPRWRAKSAAR
jgi:hypothetical protein